VPLALQQRSQFPATPADEIVNSFFHEQFAIEQDAQQQKRFTLWPGPGNDTLASFDCVERNT